MMESLDSLGSGGHWYNQGLPSLESLCPSIPWKLDPGHCSSCPYYATCQAKVVAVFPDCLSPIISSHWLWPIGTRLYTDFNPVCVSSCTDLHLLVHLNILILSKLIFLACYFLITHCDSKHFFILRFSHRFFSHQFSRQHNTHKHFPF